MLFPALKWIKFLRNYGPISTNRNLYDEHVTAALRYAKVQPITLPAPYLDEMLHILQTGSPCSLLIAGTAGDGKTFHCRRLWSTLGGNPEEWASEDTTIKELALPGGTKFVFVKDLTELSAQDGDKVLEGLDRSVLRGDDCTRFVIATNHGQILDRFQNWERHGGPKSHLHQHVQDFFLGRTVDLARVRIFDLSRSTHRESFNEVMAAVTEHPEWENCENCELCGGGRVCPILENRMRLSHLAESQQFQDRLGDLVEIARFNSTHLPIRDLLALTANMLLGHPDAKEGLMTCTDVPRIQQTNRVEFGSIYRNVFAGNIKRAAQRTGALPVFKVLTSFGIGVETTNAVDGLLVYGHDDVRYNEDFARLVGSDKVYGATTEYLAFQQQYLEGEEDSRTDDGADLFLDRLAGQRQRLFFSLPSDVSDRYNHWELSTFRFAGEYLDLLDCIKPDGSKRPVGDRTRGLLVKGINRVMTGLLLENHDTILIASSGGFTQSRLSVLCNNAVPARYDRDRGVGLSIRWGRQSQRPYLAISVGAGRSGEVFFELTPIRFEFLCRVAEGTLPTSFSNECYEDLLAFKARLLRQSELIRAQKRDADHEDDEIFEEAGVALSFIEIEQNGHGYLKGISVRSCK